jgi:D-xylose transport system ATP-binding protein
MIESQPPVLELKKISKRFGSVDALVNIDLAMYAGEVIALVGDNGAGKSTLIKAISGSQPADSGSFYSDGREVYIASPNDAAALGVSTIYQDLALCGNLDVVANLFLGHEIASSGWLDEPTMEGRAEQVLKALSVTTIRNLRAPVSALSGGQRQAVAIARVLLGAPRLILLDEPTAALGVAQTLQVLALIARLKERGITVILITHNLPDVFSASDRIEVLRLGQKAGSFRTADCSRSDVVGAVMGGARDFDMAG